MPPKGTKASALRARARRDNRREREAARHLEQLDLDAPPTSSSTTAADANRQGQPRNPPAPSTLIRNYTPDVRFNALKVLVILGYGANFQQFPDIPIIESTFGRSANLDQVIGLITNIEDTRQKIMDVYKMAMPADIKSVKISFTDAAGYRHEEDYEHRYTTPFGIWAGEVEGGDLNVRPACRCGVCEGTHGPEIRVEFDENKAKAVLGNTA